MIRVTFRYGSGNSFTFDLPAGTTMGQALRNPRVKAALQFDENVEGFVNGLPQGELTTLVHNSEVDVNEKPMPKGM